MSKILVVDDDDQILSVVQRSLERFGYEITCVNTADEAREAILRDEPALILLDIMLEETSATVSAFRNKESTLGKLMYEDSLYNNLNSTMLSLDSLLIHMNENPKHFFGPLGKSKKKIEKDLAKQQKQ